MVGWSRRDSEEMARKHRYREWFNQQTPEKQAEIKREEAERWKREKPWFIVLCILAGLMLFVGWPLTCLWLNHRPITEHRTINGRACLVHSEGQTSTGMVYPERIECK